MSLINQMLRDLDRRRASGATGGSDLLDGVRPPAPPPRRGLPRGLLWPLLLLLAAGIALGLWLVLAKSRDTAPPAGQGPGAAAPRQAALAAIALERSPGRVRLLLQGKGGRPAATLASGRLELVAAGGPPALPKTDEPFAGLRIETTASGLRLSWQPAAEWQYRLVAVAEHDWALEASRTRPAGGTKATSEPPQSPAPTAARAPAQVPVAKRSAPKAPADAGSPKRANDNSAANRPRIAVRPRPLAPQERAIRARQAAREALARGRPREAERHWREAIALAPRAAEGWQGLAEQLVREGRRAEALSLLREGLRRSGAPALRLLAARLLVEAGRLDEALSLLPDEALEGQADLLALKGAILQRLGRAEAARQAYVAALALRPQRPAWWMGLGLSLEGEGQPQRALEAYRRALAIPGLDQASRDFVQGRIQALEKGQ